MISILNLMIDTLHKLLAEELAPYRGSRFLLAVSGGMDSVVMAHLFKYASMCFGIAHCNFHLRGDESDTDAEFVKMLAEKLEVEYFYKTFDTATFASGKKLSIEEAARIQRYTWFENVRIHSGYDFIVTAHHADDNFETVLLHLIKGTGIHGMQGIPKRNGYILRPLLKMSRSELQMYASAKNIEYRTDSTNALNIYTRNKIRNTVLPILKEINPSLTKTFVQTNQNLTEAAHIVDTFMMRKIKKLQIPKSSYTAFSIAALNALPYKRTLLFQLLSPYDFSPEQVAGISDNLFGSGKIFLSKTHRVIIDRKFLIITGYPATDSPVYVIDAHTKKINAGNCSFKMDIIQKNINTRKYGTETACFDLDKIVFPIIVRKWKQGDFLYPAGMQKANGTPARKKVSDLFTDAKYSLPEKEDTWIFLCGNKIIWVAGLRQDYRFAAGAACRQVLKIRMSAKRNATGQFPQPINSK